MAAHADTNGGPSAGRMFRDLIPALADRYRVIAPDLPGFGQTKAPPRGEFTYGFDALADVVGSFGDALASAAMRSASSTMARRSGCGRR